MSKRKYYEPLPKYTFVAEDDWGDYENGIYRKGNFDDAGYCVHWYACTDGKGHNCLEHCKKWEYFNGKIPEGYEIDHIIPISNGGTNKLSNLRLVTPEENSNNPLTKKNISKAIKKRLEKKENHPQYGKKQSKEWIEKRTQRGENHYMYGKHQSEEVKKKISDARKGKHYPKLSEAKKGKKNPKLSEALKGKEQPLRRKPVIQINQDGSIKEWTCAFEANKYGYNNKRISACCRGNYNKKGNHTYKGCEWYFKTDYEKNNVLN